MKTFKDLIDEKLTPADLEENYKKHSGLANLYDKEMKYFKDKDDRKKMATSAIKAHTRAHTTAPNDAKKEYHKKRIEQYNSILKESEEIEEGSAFDKNMNDRARGLLHKLKDTGKKLIAPVKDPILDKMKELDAEVRKRTANESEELDEASNTLQRYGQKIIKRAKEAAAAETSDKKEEPKASSDTNYVSTRELLQQLRRKPAKKRVSESEELSEARIKPLPRRHFFDTYGNNNGIAYTDNKNWWKIMDGKVVGYANSYEDTSDWKKEFVAIQKGVKESEELEELNKTTLGSFIKKATKSVSSLDSKAKDIGFNDAGDKVFDKARRREKSIDKAVDRLTKESENIDEAMVDSWKKVQSMDKGSVLGDKEQVKKRLDYLKAVHAHHKKYGNDTKKVRADIEKINRSRLAEETEELEEGKHEGTIAAIAKHAYSPEVGHKIVTKKGGQVPGTVEKIEKDHVYFRHPEGKLFRTHVSNVQKDGK